MTALVHQPRAGAGASLRARPGLYADTGVQGALRRRAVRRLHRDRLDRQSYHRQPRCAGLGGTRGSDSSPRCRTVGINRITLRMTAGALAQQRTAGSTVNIALLGQNFLATTPDQKNVTGVFGGAGFDWQVDRMVLFTATVELHHHQRCHDLHGPWWRSPGMVTRVCTTSLSSLRHRIAEHHRFDDHGDLRELCLAARGGFGRGANRDTAGRLACGALQPDHRGDDDQDENTSHNPTGHRPHRRLGDQRRHAGAGGEDQRGKPA